MERITIARPSRILSGHLWVFSNELAESPKRYEPGSLLELKDRAGNFLGIGYVNPHSLICIRILTRQKEEINEAFFRTRITDALAYRKRFMPQAGSFRVVYSESDLLPGLIVDKYEDCLSIQFLTLGIEKWSDCILKILDEIFSPRVIALRNDSQVRSLENLPAEKKIVKGSLERLPVIRDKTTLIEIDPMSGQKTGFFLDQAENRNAFAAMAGPGIGLDLFCYSGAWSLKMAEHGATVTGVDSSEQAVGLASRNAGLNNLADRCSFVKADVFGFIKDALSKKQLYDFIVLDPPAFVKSKSKVKEALRGYRELNASCLSLLKKHGLLATSSCSHHIDRETFMGMLRSSVRDAGRNARIIEIRSQSNDHPISVAVPETEYLKCLFLEVF